MVQGGELCIEPVDVELVNVTKRFGGVAAVDGVSFTVRPGEIFALIGPNGAGKTTLFNVISGLYAGKRGRVRIEGEDVTGLAPHRLAARGLSRTFQNLQIFLRMSAAENIMVGRHLHESRNVLAHLFALPAVRRQNRRTRDTAQTLKRVTGLGAVPGTVPRRLGEILREPVLVGAVGGLVLSWLWLRDRVRPAVAGNGMAFHQPLVDQLIGQPGHVAAGHHQPP